jgi:hypothetical protein
MSRPWQVFVAPGPEEEPLTAYESPWLDGRWVTLPLGDWHAILRFAEEVDEPGGRRLWLQSGGSALAGDLQIPFEPAAIEASIDLLARTTRALKDAPPLVPEPTEAQPEAYANEELARMASLVLHVMQEALSRREPFRAWNE